MSDALINGLAGAGGGIIAQLLTYPLQTVNTRQQTDRDPNEGTIEQMLQVVKHQGLGRLYAGLAPSLVGTAMSQGVYYYFYQIFRDRAEAIAMDRKRKGMGDGSVGMFSSLVVAALSGCVNVLLTNPIWVVVTRIQSGKSFGSYIPCVVLVVMHFGDMFIFFHSAITALKMTHTKSIKKPESAQLLSVVADEIVLDATETPSFGTSHVVHEVYDEAGIFGFWKGVFPTLIMVSNPSMQFMLYETMLKKLKRRRLLRKGGSQITALEIFLLGAIAKLGATVVTYPLLVVKSRLQAKQVTMGDKRHHYEGTLDAILKMLHYEGFRGFYKGMSTKIVQSIFAAAILFMVKEELVNGARLLLTGGRNAARARPP